MLVSDSLTNKDRSFLRLAARVAGASEMKQKHGAVIVKGGRVMSVGINKWRNDPENIESEKARSSCSTHAEVDALSRVNNPSGATLYIARVNRSGKSLLSAPCENCWVAIRNSGIRKVVFT